MNPIPRGKILVRDNYTCQYCHKKLNQSQLHIDHIIPRSLGGSDHEKNLVVACVSCNLKKSDKLGLDLKKQVLGIRAKSADNRYYMRLLSQQEHLCDWLQKELNATIEYLHKKTKELEGANRKINELEHIVNRGKKTTKTSTYNKNRLFVVSNSGCCTHYNL